MGTTISGSLAVGSLPPYPSMEINAVHRPKRKSRMWKGTLESLGSAASGFWPVASSKYIKA